MFKDPNLQLAILEAAWDAKLLPAFDKDAFYRDVLGETWDANRDGGKADKRTRDALLALALPPQVLERIEVLDWRGGESAQHLVFHFWDGEDGMFDVTDLAGIGKCAKLRKVSFGAARLADLRPLLDLPALRELDVAQVYVDNEQNRGVLRALKERGVALETREDLAAQASRQSDAGELRRAIEKGMRAFQEKRFADVVKALADHEGELQGSERVKLAFARKQVAKP